MINLCQDIFMLIGILCFSIAVVFFIGWLIYIIKANIEERIHKNDRYLRNKRKKDILKSIEDMVKTDICFGDFDNSTYSFKRDDGHFIETIEFK